MILGFIHPGTVHTGFMESIFNFLAYDSKHRQLFNGFLNAQCAYIPDARNRVCQAFLDKTNDEWLLFLDYDILFDPITVYQMLDSADPVTKPIMSGLYVTRFGEGNFIHPCWMEDIGGEVYTPVSHFAVGEIKEITVCGMGFTLIHRSVLEKMKEAHKNDPWHWFGHDQIGNDRVGEDLTFCTRARNLGYKIYGHCGVLLGHIKSSTLTVRDMQSEAAKFTPIATDKKFLNVGSGDKRNPVPADFIGWERVNLDIDPSVKPDIVADARDLSALKQDDFDGVYSSHNLEHFNEDDARIVLRNMYGVLKDEGKVHIRVPDIGLVRDELASGKNLDDEVYVSPSGPVTYRDMIEGFGPAIRSGNEWMRHKTCFTRESLESFLVSVGFKDVRVEKTFYELQATARK